MKLKVTTIIAALIIAVTLMTACGATDAPATSMPVQPTQTPIRPTAAPVPETTLEPQVTEDSVIHRNIPFVPGGNFQQKLSVFLPVEEAGGHGSLYPVVILAHGYVHSLEDPPLRETMRFLNQLGYAAVTVDYRDDPKSGNPSAALSDVACGLAWVYANADTYGLDVDRMAAFGNSYGAEVMTTLALADEASQFLTDCPNSLPDVPPFKGVIPFAAATFGVPGEGLMISSELGVSFYYGGVHGTETMEEMRVIQDELSGLTPAEWATSVELSPEARAFAQTLPAYWVNAGDPPLLLLYPGQDSYSQLEYDAFAGLLEAAGAPYTYLVLPDALHADWGPLGKTDPATWQEPIQGFLEEIFAE
jgi:acetyl esterase/lipase